MAPSNQNRARPVGPDMRGVDPFKFDDHDDDATGILTDNALVQLLNRRSSAPPREATPSGKTQPHVRYMRYSVEPPAPSTKMLSGSGVSGVQPFVLAGVSETNDALKSTPADTNRLPNPPADASSPESSKGKRERPPNDSPASLNQEVTALEDNHNLLERESLALDDSLLGLDERSLIDGTEQEEEATVAIGSEQIEGWLDENHANALPRLGSPGNDSAASEGAAPAGDGDPAADSGDVEAAPSLSNQHEASLRASVSVEAEEDEFTAESVDDEDATLLFASSDASTALSGLPVQTTPDEEPDAEPSLAVSLQAEPTVVNGRKIDTAQKAEPDFRAGVYQVPLMTAILASTLTLIVWFFL